ncbi:MAG: hopanoid biosynthesis-associated protein HpnK [Verrucomicrobia bacterium]|nr:hopanoid biosynthesis-associated protein HpnK [Verrucomicrobiota bacterium]
MPRGSRRRLIVNADDFGRSPSINQAVLRAHREGILTTASLMVNGDAFDEAVRLAREHPQLGVGLHLALICGRSALPHDQIPGLVDPQQNFTNNPVAAGLRYFFDRSLRPQLRREIDAQFQKFFSTGLRLDHVNGHLHLHLHPTVFRILEHNVGDWQITHLRFTRDFFFLNLRLASGRLLYRVGHAVLFWFLSRRVRRALQRERIRHTQAVFGLLQDSHVDEDYVTRLLPRLPPGDSELYSHPSLDQFKHEMDALLSPRVRALVAQQHIQLIRYQDL